MAKRRKRASRVQKLPPHRGAVILNGRSMPAPATQPALTEVRLDRMRLEVQPIPFPEPREAAKLVETMRAELDRMIAKAFTVPAHLMPAAPWPTSIRKATKAAGNLT